MKIGLISGAYPPDLDGIGDYTWKLSQALARGPHHQITVYTSAGRDRAPTDGVCVEGVFGASWASSFRELEERLVNDATETLDWIVLQYNPFSFGRRGFCPWVPRMLHTLRKQEKRPRLAVMFHETVVPRWPWRFAVMYLWQSPIFRSVCRAADIAFVSTERWKPQVKAGNSRLPCEHLPVCSNIEFCSVSQAEARAELGIAESALVFGIFGSAHISRMLDWSAAAVRGVVESRMHSKVHGELLLLYVGADGAAVEQAFADCGISVINAGVIQSSKVGVYLRAMDVILSPFSDGVSTRRGSVLAALQHGVPVATNLTGWSDVIFRDADKLSGFVATQGGKVEYAEAVLGLMRSRENGTTQVPDRRLMHFYESNFGVDRLAERLVAMLKANERLHEEDLAR